jgi:hypothetical protein
MTLDGRVGLWEVSTHVVGEARKWSRNSGTEWGERSCPCISIGLLRRTAIGGAARRARDSRRALLAAADVLLLLRHLSIQGSFTLLL